MDRPPLKVSFPSEISAAFCAVLSENDIGYSSEIKVVRPGDGSFDFIVNSADDLKEIAIAVIESKPFWSAVVAAIWAFARRHKHKVVYIEIDGYKFRVSGMSPEEISRMIRNAKNVIITEEDH